MENDELHHRVNAIHRIKLIATIMGPDGTKNQLLPYLENLMKKEEDEVLFAIAEELFNLASILGGNQTILIPHLETLAAQEETVVRERAIKSLINLSTNLSESDIQNLYVPLILRLAANDTNFTCRVSAVNLIVPIYQRAG
jgi:serine/threonine-protein phosphatase 2A regulatory subunit A